MHMKSKSACSKGFLGRDFCGGIGGSILNHSSCYGGASSGCGLHQFNGDTSPIALGLVKPFVDTNEWHHQGFDDVKGARPGECPAVLKSFFAMREAEMRRCGLAAIRHSEIIVNLLLGQNGFDCVQGLSMKAEYLIVGHHRGRAHENYPLALGWQAAHS
jgi:hypothetical protein